MPAILGYQISNMKSKLCPLCRQCAEEIGELEEYRQDFADLCEPIQTITVECTKCGPTRVNHEGVCQRGNCNRSHEYY